MSVPLKVLLVEDSLVLAQRLKEVLGELPDVELVAAVDTEDATIALMRRRVIDVIILDLHLKQGTGFGVLKAMAALHAKPCVIVLTNYDLPQYKEESLALGATCFLDKALDFPRLPEVIREMTIPR